MSLRVVFAGTPDFALPSLKALLIQGHDVCAIYTKPDSTSGRGLKLTPSPVKQFIQSHYDEIPILQPIGLKDVAVQEELRALNADVMVVIAYGFILPEKVISTPKYGCINVHASLLPRWRGAAPIQRALLAGDTVTGITIMQIDVGLDTGAILHQVSCDITDTTTTQELHDELAALGAQALLETLKKIEEGSLEPINQDNSAATYATKIAKEEAIINWQHHADEISRQVRAFNPWPGAHTLLGGQILKVWEVEVLLEAHQKKVGTIIAVSEEGIDVAAQNSILRLITIQLAGGKAMPAKQFLNARGKLVIPGETILGL